VLRHRWHLGYRVANYPLAKEMAVKLGSAVAAQAADVVAGDCHLANGSITEESGREPTHPVQVLARAYGIPAEE
jgi:Fe-S oxidoreductase